jgi:LacI family transcriptional regulator
MNNGSRRRGRPPLDDSVKQRVLELAQGAGKDRSLRWMGREVGISPVSVRSILEKAGLWKRRSPSDVNKGRKRGPTADFVSLSKVAEVAGVSKSTASLALKGSPKIKESTCERVKEAARKLNYRAHPYVGAHMASVRSGRMNFVQESIAFVYSALRGEKSNWADLCQIPWGPGRKFEAAQKAAFKRGYLLHPHPLFEYGLNTQRLDKVLHSRGIRGLLLDVPSYYSAISKIDLNNFSCVAFREQDPIRLHVVGHDVFRTVLIAFARLWQLGYRRIAFYTSDAQSTSTLFARDAAFRHAQYHLASPEDRLPILHYDTILKHYRDSVFYGEKPVEINRYGECDWLVRNDWTGLRQEIENGAPVMESIQSAILKRWLEDYFPDAIICESGDMVEQLTHFGYSVPKDIGVVHCNLNSDVDGWSGIRRADELIASQAVDLLIEQIDQNKRGIPKYPTAKRILGEWVDGSTTDSSRLKSASLPAYAQHWISKILEASSDKGGIF